MVKRARLSTTLRAAARAGHLILLIAAAALLTPTRAAAQAPTTATASAATPPAANSPVTTQTATPAPTPTPTPAPTPAPVPTPGPDWKPANIAGPAWGTDAAVSSQFSAANGAANLTDGSAAQGHGWLSQDNAPLPQQVTFTFEKEQYVVGMRAAQAAWNEGMYRARDLSVELTPDGTNWTKVGAASLDQAASATCQVEFPPTLARGLRLTITSSYNPVQTCGLGEVEIMALEPPAAKAPYTDAAETIAWDTLRGHFRMNLQLDPPAGAWRALRRDAKLSANGEFQSGPYHLTLTESEAGPQARQVAFSLTRDGGTTFTVLEQRVECRSSYSGVYKIFTPGTFSQQNYKIDLPFRIEGGSRAEIDQPVIWMQQPDGQNTLTFGLIDQVPVTAFDGSTYDPSNGGEAPGIANSYVRAALIRTRPASAAPAWHDALYVNANPDQSWFEALSAYGAAVDAARGFKPRPASEWAMNPMWHSWYAHGDQIDEGRIRDDAQRAGDLGFTTIELDAGWNIPAGKPYSFDNEGDYTFAADRFPNPKGMIDAMHVAGQRVILHVAPLIMGKNAKAWAQMQDCLIQVGGKPDPHLDPRLKKVHDYLLGAWEGMFTQYGIDGLWYDFLELPPQADAPAPGQALVSADLHEAYAALMRALYERALALNPNAVIILRRASANLEAKTYATHVWPMDVPQDYNMNRRDVLYMKTFGPGVLTHACCTSWAISESELNVARQMASIVLAGVPAVSVKLDASPAAHNAVMKAWLAFYAANRKDLVQGQMTPLLVTPPSGALRVEGDAQAFFGFFEAVPGLVTLSKPVAKVTLINALSRRLTTRLEGAPGEWRAQIYDRLWQPVGEPVALKADEAGGVTLNLTGPEACFAAVLTRP